MKDNTLVQLGIQALRYAQGRDDHLAPFGATSNLRELVNYLIRTNSEMTVYLIDKLRDEIDWDLKTRDRDQNHLWMDFYVELGNIKIEMKEVQND